MTTPIPCHFLSHFQNSSFNIKTIALVYKKLWNFLAKPVDNKHYNSKCYSFWNDVLGLPSYGAGILPCLPTLKKPRKKSSIFWCRMTWGTMFTKVILLLMVDFPWLRKMISENFYFINMKKTIFLSSQLNEF